MTTTAPSRGFDASSSARAAIIVANAVAAAAGAADTGNSIERFSSFDMLSEESSNFSSFAVVFRPLLQSLIAPLECRHESNDLDRLSFSTIVAKDTEVETERASERDPYRSRSPASSMVIGRALHLVECKA